jgi:CBS domain-containing protein
MSLHDVIARMRQRRVRRVPVLDGLGYLCGLLSSDDIVRLLAGELQAMATAMTEQREREELVRP